MRVGLVVAQRTTSIHGRFDPRVLWTPEHRALTGSEGTFFLMGRELAKNHEVTMYCDTVWEGEMRGVHYRHVDNALEAADAFIAQDEPLLLTRPDMTPGSRRILWRQCNHFPHWGPEEANAADTWVAASPVHARFLTEIAPVDWTWIPNPVNLDLFQGTEERQPNTIVWCSSPDRGLHRLIEIFPEIRRQVPAAELRVYYRFDPWYESAKNIPQPSGQRARFIHECLRRLGRNGENGLYMMGAVPNSKLTRELMKTSVMAYTCEPISFTEGFSVSTMDACAAGAVPIISDVDALGDVYKGAAHIIPGRPGDNQQEWIDAIVRALKDEEWCAPVRQRVREFAQAFSIERIGVLWEKVLAKQPRPHSISAFVGDETISLDARPIPQAALDLGLTERRRKPTFTHLCNPVPIPEGQNPSWWSFIDEHDVRDAFWAIQRGDVVLDIGAAYGSYTLPALGAGAAYVHAWAPEGDEGTVLQLSVADNGWDDRITVHRNGLWSRSGWLRCFPGLRPSEYYPTEAEARDEEEGAAFPVTCLDDLAVERVDWIKLDVEGAEVEVVRGGLETIAKHRPKILVENHLFKDQTIPERLRVLLRDAAPYEEVGTIFRGDNQLSHTLYTCK